MRDFATMLDWVCLSHTEGLCAADIGELQMVPVIIRPCRAATRHCIPLSYRHHKAALYESETHCSNLNANCASTIMSTEAPIHRPSLAMDSSFEPNAILRGAQLTLVGGLTAFS